LFRTLKRKKKEGVEGRKDRRKGGLEDFKGEGQRNEHLLTNNEV
jgi:hypothetical protein